MFGARGEHGDVFLFSKQASLHLLMFYIKIFIACLFKGSQEQSFFLQTLLFMAFLVTVLKILTYICICEHMILGQLTMGARQTKNAPLLPLGHFTPARYEGALRKVLSRTRD